MKTMIASIDLVIECRDYRTPIVSRNPLFEETLGEKPRLIVYTKQDLGSNRTAIDRRREEIIREWDRPSNAMFANAKNRFTVQKILDFARRHSEVSHSILGSRMMIVGMPNVGKSSLLNALRSVGVGGKKAAKTGDQPGITRKIATSVKIIEGQDGQGGVYVLDTPGVFVPYMPDAESMLKLALCGSVKDTIIAPEMVADYLLYHLNITDPTLYGAYSEPTNDISELLGRFARRIGRLKKGGIPDLEAAAVQLVQIWRAGNLGRFVLDDVTEDALLERQSFLSASGTSLNQAKKAVREARRRVPTAETVIS
ncbi:putative mitochondrial gtpase [Phaeomoniella chlamydospora]|uniref:Mitochondrial GTPase 1 n=1 Tax=Phaeomoniella chlamydospora TaxID=158046 RepID=A0A0G2GY22_PHACM|nr:putative mitochondrial gtpase [Phaeomoniella chlamydospora]